MIAPTRYFKRPFLYLALVVPLLAVGACSVNPATGKQSFTAFMSEEKEKEVGATENPKIVEQFGGVYEDANLGFTLPVLAPSWRNFLNCQTWDRPSPF
jgi:hypothetical protein